jgi:hypothetical protein
MNSGIGLGLVCGLEVIGLPARASKIGMCRIPPVIINSPAFVVLVLLRGKMDKDALIYRGSTFSGV